MAGTAIILLIKMRWELNLIKTFTILILIYGIIFSTTTYISRIYDMPPQNELIEGLEWIKENTNEDAIVFSHYTNGFWIESIAKRIVLLDEKPEYILKAEETHKDSEIIFYSRNLKNTTALLDKYGVTTILITEQMKHDLWRGEEEGLLFLFNDKDNFKQLFVNEEVEVWSYSKKEKESSS